MKLKPSQTGQHGRVYTQVRKFLGTKVIVYKSPLALAGLTPMARLKTESLAEKGLTTRVPGSAAAGIETCCRR